MKTKRMEQLGMVTLFGELDFQLMRLQQLRDEEFDLWENQEKAAYYQTARRLIEGQIKETDRTEEMEKFRGLLRNRYETFLAQILVEERPGHMVNALFNLSQIAEHEEYEGEGKKYLLQTLPWISKLDAEDQEYFSENLVEFFDGDLDTLLLVHERTVGTWEHSKMLALSFEILEAMAEDGQVDTNMFMEVADHVEGTLRKCGEGELTLRFTNFMVQLAKRHKANGETKEHFWRKAFEAGLDFHEPYTKMLMSALLADRMKDEENWYAANYFLQHLEGVSETYGAEVVCGSNFDQITEAMEDVRKDVKEHGYYEKLS